MSEELIPVCIYADNVPEYPKELIDYLLDGPGNVVTVSFPKSIVMKWYRKDHDSDDGFEEWYTDEYNCDDVDGLYLFAKDEGFDPNPPEFHKYTVEYTATYEVYAANENEAIEISERLGGSTDCYIYIDGEPW